MTPRVVGQINHNDSHIPVLRACVLLGISTTKMLPCVIVAFDLFTV